MKIKIDLQHEQSINGNVILGYLVKVRSRGAKRMLKEVNEKNEAQEQLGLNLSFYL